MSFLLDTNICSAHLKRPGGLTHRLIQYMGRLYLPTVVLGELYAWAYRRSNSSKLLHQIENELLHDMVVLDYDRACAEKFGQVRGTLLQHGIVVDTTDLMIASVALVHDLTLITNNTADFRFIPDLRLDDWLTP
ncbi:MAG: type II toxin-antitoxin system VapC family toxin [Thermoguttaceae bacterium]|jgi:tRNA(fMet)-specific endonuclease VapC